MALKTRSRKTQSVAKVKGGADAKKPRTLRRGAKFTAALIAPHIQKHAAAHQVAEPPAPYGGLVVKRAPQARKPEWATQRADQLATEQETKIAGKLLAELETDAATAADVTTLCDNYGLRREELGRLTGFSLRALADWAAGKVPSQPAHRRLREIRRLLDALSALVAKEAITPWLHQKNPAFDDFTPLQVIETGEIDRLWAMVHERAAGLSA